MALKHFPNREELCLLDTDPPDQGMVQRRVIEIDFDGVSEWREFDIVRIFENRSEALIYASEHGMKLSED